MSIILNEESFNRLKKKT